MNKPKLLACLSSLERKQAKKAIKEIKRCGIQAHNNEYWIARDSCGAVWIAPKDREDKSMRRNPNISIKL